jgi:hypothetical protein
MWETVLKHAVKNSEYTSDFEHTWIRLVSIPHAIFNKLWEHLGKESCPMAELITVSYSNDWINYYCTANCTSIKVSQKVLKYRPCTLTIGIDIVIIGSRIFQTWLHTFHSVTWYTEFTKTFFPFQMPHGFMERSHVIPLTLAGKHELSCANFHESHRFTTALHADLLQQI